MNDDQPRPEILTPTEREMIASRAGVAKARETLERLKAKQGEVSER